MEAGFYDKWQNEGSNEFSELCVGAALSLIRAENRRSFLRIMFFVRIKGKSQLLNCPNIYSIQINTTPDACAALLVWINQPKLLFVFTGFAHLRESVTLPTYIIFFPNKTAVEHARTKPKYTILSKDTVKMALSNNVSANFPRTKLLLVSNNSDNRNSPSLLCKLLVQHRTRTGNLCAHNAFDSLLSAA